MSMAIITAAARRCSASIESPSHGFPAAYGTLYKPVGSNASMAATTAPTTQIIARYVSLRAGSGRCNEGNGARMTAQNSSPTARSWRCSALWMVSFRYASATIAGRLQTSTVALHSPSASDGEVTARSTRVVT